MANRKKKILIALSTGLVAGIIILLMSFGHQTRIQDPNKDDLLDPDEGYSYAALYEHGELYETTDGNDDVMRLIQTDFVTFARNAIPELGDPSRRVGFTFIERAEKQGESTVFKGRYYGSSDDVEIKLTNHGRGVYTMSMSNLITGKNVDELLQLNGRRNEFIKKLPINETYYSIRYQLVENRIVVSFYDGYSKKDVVAVETLLNNDLGSRRDIVFSINRVGIVDFNEVERRAQ